MLPFICLCKVGLNLIIPNLTTKRLNDRVAEENYRGSDPNKKTPLANGV